MASTLRLPSVLHGVPARLSAVMLLTCACGWTLWPKAEIPSAPPTLAMDGKHGDRLAFSGGDETEIPVRESRIYDTIAMFAQPSAEPRAWSEAPVRATVAEAGIRPVTLRPTPPQRLAAARAGEAKPMRLASSEPKLPSAKAREPQPVSVFGWSIPGSQHLPDGRDAAHALDRVGNGAVALGSGTIQAVSTTASSLGSGVSRARGAIADTLGL